MKNTRLVFSLLSILAIQINSCKKIDSGTFEFSTKILGGMVQTTVRGIIVDEFGNKVSGAVVTSGSSTTTSDTAGVFILQNINAYEKLGFVKATKSGYFLGSRSFVPVEGGTNVKIRMLSK